MPAWRSVAKDLLPPALVRGVKTLTRRPQPQVVRQPQVAPYPHDEFLRWLTWINPGMLARSNLALMSHAIRVMPDAGAVLEIGSFAGLSLNHIIYMIRQAGRTNPVFSVDKWQFEGHEAADSDSPIPASSVRRADYRDHVIETFRRNLLLFHSDQLPHHIVLSSDEFFRVWTEEVETVDFFGRVTKLGGPISFAYIDGDHTYEQSWRDFKHIDRFLLPGGFIIFDDSADGADFGCVRTAREAATQPDYELIDKTGNYCIAKRRGASRGT